MARKVVKSAAPRAPLDPRPEFHGPILQGLRGHEAPVRALLDALSRGRLASTLLFAGPSGVGKKRAALGLAQSLVCERATPSACGACGPCVRVANVQNESVLLVEPQGAGIKIEQAREILRFLALRQLGRARVVIVDEAHLLNPQAGNSLLKALEEPPPGTHFVLVTSQPGALLPTIRSRAQTIRFQALADEVVAALTGAPDWVVRAAQGSVEAAARFSGDGDGWESLRRSALGALDEMVSGRWPEGLEGLRESAKDRDSALFISRIWGRALRDFAFYSAQGGLVEGRSHLPDQAELTRRGARLPVGWLEQLSELCLQLEQDIARNVDKGLAFENFCLSAIGAYSGREPRPVLG